MLNFKSFQSVNLIGRLGQDARFFKTQKGLSMLSLGIATSESVKNAEGKYEQKTVWHDALLFGARAEKVAPSLVKGTLVAVQAHLSYKDAVLEGGKKVKLASVIVDDFQILASPAKTEGTQKSAPAASSAPASTASAEEDWNGDDFV